MTPAKGTIFELCARLAPTADDVSILIGTVRPAGAEPVSVLGCRVDGADPEDCKAVIPMSPLEGWDRPVYATASGGVIGRWVVAGEVATIVLGTDESRVEAVAEDLPADLVAAP